MPDSDNTNSNQNQDDQGLFGDKNKAGVFGENQDEENAKSLGKTQEMDATQKLRKAMEERKKKETSPGSETPVERYDPSVPGPEQTNTYPPGPVDQNTTTNESSSDTQIARRESKKIISDEPKEIAPAGTREVTPAGTQEVAQRPTAITPQSPFRSTPESVRHLRRTRENLSAAVSQIRNGEFSSDGVGEMGMAYKLISEEPPENMSTVWGEIISFCATLWDSDYKDESIMLLEAAHRSFRVPEDMEEQVKNSLMHSNNYKMAQNAEEAFSVGADQEAMTIAKNIKGGDDEQSYYQELLGRINNRKKSRRTAFIVAGVAIVGLLTISVVSLTTASRLYQEAPTPTFEGFGQNIEDVSSQLRQQRDSIDEVYTGPTTPPNAEQTNTLDQDLANPGLSDQPSQSNGVEQLLQQTTPQSPPQNQQTSTVQSEPSPSLDQNQGTGPNQQLQNQSSPLNDLGQAQQSNQGFQPPAQPTQNNPQQNVNGGQQSPTPQPQGQQAPAPQAQAQQAPQQQQQAQQSTEPTQQDCFLGYAVYLEGQRMLQTQLQDPQTDQRARDIFASYQNTLETACLALNLTQAQITEGMARIDEQTIRTVTRNLLMPPE